jgi:predicted outer membrane repeat protein
VVCTPDDHTACGSDNDIYWFDSCDVQGSLVEDCVDPNGECVETGDGPVCQCQGGWAEADCNTCVRFVDGSVSSTGDGLTWATAYLTVQEGINNAASEVLTNADVDVCDVWVAAGIYYIYDTASTDTVQLQPNVLVFGGFVGDETARDQRDFNANTTALDGTNGTSMVHVYHVVTGSDGALIDGFTITGGNANGSTSYQDRGGGMLNDGASPTVNHCLFAFNDASEHGGAIANIGGAPTVLNSRFVSNTAGDNGGAIFSQSNSDLSLESCVFRINSALDGGGVASHDSDGTFINCTFSDNSATNGLSVWGEAGGTVGIFNSILWGSSGGQAQDDSSAAVVMAYSDVVGIAATFGNINQDPQFVTAEDLHLTASSPCIDAADTTAAPTLDLEGNPRVDDSDTPNTGIGSFGLWADMGAFEFQP